MNDRANPTRRASSQYEVLNAKRRASHPQSVPVRYGCRAFAPLGAQGLNCTCHVAVYEGHIVGTMTLYASDGEASCELYRHGDVASLRQFAVDPAWQRRGIGTLLIAFAERWAAMRGYAQLALDTPRPATQQIAFHDAADVCGLSRIEAPDASATIAICCGKYCNGGSGRAILNAVPTQRGQFASGEA
ncbi:GNAT superfamily N-acetyltransferase [Paraburkholderia sp. MM5496-R1]|uniref:GNAT family N-acetyltransferase n=1 Tax=Paraburkholderia sp. MM5496-R1 TaxID=2991065 RepID=UPI003D1AE723